MISLQELFPVVDNAKEAQLNKLVSLVIDWNQKINLVSRKDIGNLVPHHLIPSLAISLIFQFSNNTKILDVGTGGGFPGLPLSICFPNANFMLMDSILKKVKVVKDLSENLNLMNVHTKQVRAETLAQKFDFIIGRAVTALPTFLDWTIKNLRPGKNSTFPNGILYFKGHDYQTELQGTNIKPTEVFNLEELFQGKFCQDKNLLYFEKEGLTHLLE